MIRYAAMVVASLVTLSVSAQLGRSVEECGKIWGTPTNGQLDEEGNGTLSYEFKGMGVELEFAHSAAFGAGYVRAAFSQAELDALLQLNACGNDWHVWTPPGIPASEVKDRLWFRADEAADAELKGRKFIIQGRPILLAADLAEKKSTARRSPAKASVAPPKNEVRAAVKQPRKVATKAKPEELVPVVKPELGWSRARVLKECGEPNGVMDRADREVMVYRWGAVWIKGNEVVEVQ